VIVRPVPTGFAIPLPYGPGVDWHRNLVATGHGVLAVHGIRYTVTAPRTVPAAEVTDTLSPLSRRLLRGIAEWVVVSAAPSVPPSTRMSGAEPGPSSRLQRR
jgi:hypothetical protein